MAITQTNESEPSTPGSGESKIYVDSTSKLLSTKNDAGTVKSMADASTTISAGAGLTGGGSLAANRTIALDINGQTADASPVGSTDYVITYDASAGGFKKVLLDDLPGGGGGGSGDVSGPGSSVDNAIVRFDGTGGKTIQGYTSNAPTITDDGVASFSNSTYASSERIGFGSSVGATGATAFGNTASAGGQNAVAVGYGTTASAIGAVAIGYFATASNSSAFALGSSVTASGSASMAIGGGASATQSSTTAVGYAAAATGSNSTVLGRNAQASGTDGIAIGSYTTCNFSDSMAIGRAAAPEGSNQCIIGSEFARYNTFYIGSGIRNGNGVSTSVTVQASRGNTAGTDIDGSDLVLRTGTATGAGSGGSFQIDVAADGGTSGTTENTTFNTMLLANSAQELVLTAMDAATADGTLWNNSISFYLDESGNNLIVKAKYSGGTVVTGTVAALA